MKSKPVLRSPLFYVGDKYKLVEEIKTHLPPVIGRLIEPFVGGGSVFMNVRADAYLLNDIDPTVIGLHRWLCANCGRAAALLDGLLRTIREYGLSCSYTGDVIPEELKKRHPKTYYAVYNKTGYRAMKDDYNRSEDRPWPLLYLLKIYGFNRMHRFNGRNEFNLPVGNVDFNANVAEALEGYFGRVRNSDITWSCLHFEDFIGSLAPKKDDLVYLDPPYLITCSEYNKLWNEGSEARLLALLDRLDRQGTRFAISNVTHYKGRVNGLFLEWAEKYRCHGIRSNYISYHDNSRKSFGEVLVTNY